MLDLAAGDLTAVLDGPDIRQVAVAGHLGLQMIYVTVRDAGWRTAPGEITAVQQSDDGRVVTVDVRHRLDELSFRWRGTIELTPNRLKFSIDGVAESAFDANRIGLCLLHPQSLRGAGLVVGGPNGEQAGEFTATISPHQPFVDLDRIAYSVSVEDQLQILLTGDLFEMEDHRNWSDPGWKTYCTPLARPAPVHYAPGQRVRQSIELTAVTDSAGVQPPTSSVGGGATSARRSAGDPAPSEPVHLVVGQPSGRFPDLGLGASDGINPEDADRSLSRILAKGRPGHLHVELEHGQDWRPRLIRATAEAETFDLPVDVALIAVPHDLPAMATAVGVLGERLHRVSVFDPDRHITQAGTVDTIRGLLADVGRSAQFGGGSRANLAELNRGHFDCANWDFVTYGLNPQVHHTDDRSIMSTVAAIADGLAQAGRVAGDVPVVVGPLTLRPRFNAYTGGADPLPDSHGPAPDIDPRQADDLAGVYLAAAITRLMGARAITAYRTIGPRGIVSMDGEPWPSAVVFAAFAALAGVPAYPVTSATDDLVAVAGETTVLIANVSDTCRHARIVDAHLARTELLVGQTPAGRAHPDPSSYFSLPPRSVLRLHVQRGHPRD